MKHQKFSEIDALIVKREIADALIGKKLKSILMKAQREFVFRLDKNYLLVSVHPTRYRIHLIDHSGVSPTQPVSSDVHFVPFEEHLKGFTLVDVRVKKWDRLVYLIFSRDRGLRTYVLAVELTGKHSNLILVDEEGKIVDSFIKIPPSRSTVRPVIPGIEYTPPPPKPFDPQKDVEKLAKYIPWFTPPYGEKVYLALNEPRAIYCGEADIYTPVDIGCGAKREFESYSALLDFYFGKIREGAASRKEKEDPILRQLEKVKDYEKYRIIGEKLLAGDFEEHDGKALLKVEGELIEVPIKGKISETAEEYFKKYRRYKRGYEKLLKKLGKKAEKVESASKEEDVYEPFEKFVSPGGFLVYRGKNARGNEYITFHLASPEDYFLHVEDSPGSHVIIKSGRADVGDEDLEFAARLALERSKKSQDMKGTVLVTRKKYVKRGENPGQVLLIKILKTIEVRLK